jgi:pilus assembly protein CpaC
MRCQAIERDPQRTCGELIRRRCNAMEDIHATVPGRRPAVGLLPYLIFIILPLVASAVNAQYRLPAVSGEKIRIFVGTSRVIEFDSRVTRVSIGNPEIADVLVVGTSRQVLINAKSQGTTSLGIWDESDRVMLFDVLVSSDIINAQVVLQVRFAEAQRRALRETGVDLFLRDDAPTVIAPNELDQITGVSLIGETASKRFDALPDELAGSVTGILRVKPKSGDVAAIIRALEEEGKLSTLAEPNLVALSGQEASFLAGGEFPVPIVTQNTVNIEYKEFGIKLNFLPTVVDTGRINLKVMPEVSSLDFDNAVTFAGFRIPATRARRAETTVEMQSGESLILAGLLSGTLGENVRKIPLFGDIPILGQLFRSERYQADETELVIVITPSIARSYSPVRTPPPRD